MANWIKHPLTLRGEKVILMPLNEVHFEELIDASGDEIIWTYMPVKGADRDKLLLTLKEALIEKEKRGAVPISGNR